MSSDSKDVQDLVDRIQIQELFNRFCDILDLERNFTLFRDVFTDDVVADWPRERQTTGLQAFIEFIERAFYFLGPTHHQIGNFSATIDVDSADAVVHLRAYHQGTEPVSDLFEESLATFKAHAVRTPVGWRLNYWCETIYIVLGTRAVFRDGEDRPKLQRTE